MPRRSAWLLLPVLLPALAGCSSMLRWDSPSNKHASTHSSRQSAAVQPRAPGAEEYRVRSGDTLYAIAFRNQLDYRDLAKWNGIGSGYLISPGQVLRLRPPGASAPERPPLRNDTVVVKPVGPAAPMVQAPSAAAGVIPAAPAVAAADTGTQPQGFEWLWPTTGTILRTYAPQAGFKGLDFGGNLGQPVFAAAPGRVVYSGNALKGYGELIIIKHNDTYLSAYGYNRKRNVNEGDVVTAGQPIAELGLGPENKPFLHFEIRERGQPVDPMRFLPKRETTPGSDK